MHRADLQKPPRTPLTVQVGEASALASKSGYTGIVGSLEQIRANGAKIDSAFRHMARGRGRSDSHEKAVTIDERDVVGALSVRLTQGKLDESDGRIPCFPEKVRGPIQPRGERY